MNEGAGLNILVDFIVYMALEDISFFRFLDFGEHGDSACQKLLEWIDYDYFAENGTYTASRPYKNIAENWCNGNAPILKNAIST